MAKETKTITLRLPIEQMEYLENFEGSINQTIVNLIERIRLIEKYSDKDIDRTFSDDEFRCMFDILKGLRVEGDYRYQCSTLIAQIENECESDAEYTKRWGVDVCEMTDKIASLSASAIDAIYRRVEKQPS